MPKETSDGERAVRGRERRSRSRVRSSSRRLRRRHTPTVQRERMRTTAERRRRNRETSSSSRTSSRGRIPRRRRRERKSRTRQRSESRRNVDENNKDNSFTTDQVIQLIKSLPSNKSNHFAMLTNTVPEFNPSNKEQTIVNWIKKVEECALLYEWSEPQIIHYALPKLNGVAKVWYEGLTSVQFTWQEWKAKLIKTFPSVQNYAQLLHEMLDRKVNMGENLETYFYHKMNLLNRCEISGKRAIDCIMDGLEDRGLRLGAQAANFTEPESLLGYLKSIKIDDVKEKRVMNFKRRNEGQKEVPHNKTSTIKCFNCGEIGHPSFKCSKPLISCNICKRLGHQASSCTKMPKSNNEVKPEGVNVVVDTELKYMPDDKYVMNILANGISKTCYVDLGSQCTLMRLSDFLELKLELNSNDKKKKLKGFGNCLIEPIGAAVIRLKLQDVEAGTEAV